MKRCPQCHRLETDEALKFCRVDGATLVSDSLSIGSEAGTAQLKPPSDQREVHTSILPGRTDANINRATAPTTVLPTLPPIATTEKKPRKRLIFVTVVVTALVAATAAIFVDLYRSRKSSGAAIQSIAVMPFVNESGNADVEYLSDGMTEALISSLAQLPNLNVKSRSTVFRYKGKETDANRIGKELSVQAILNGRVLQRGDQVTLSLELVNTETENVIWSDQYNRKQSDLVNLQTEIARDVSSKLKSKLSGADEQRLTKSYTANSEAYQLYLRGRFFLTKNTEENINKAIGYFQQAIAKDPNYALAYTGLADSYSNLFFPVAAVAPREVMPKAREAALHALAIDDTLAEGHASLSLAKFYYDWDFTGAEVELKRAIELNPSLVEAHHYYSHFLTAMGRPDESLAESRRCLELEPSSVLLNVHLGWHYLYAHQTDPAVAQLQRTLEMDPNFAQTNHWLGLAYEQQGKYPEAVATLQKALAIFGESTQTRAELAHAYASAGKKDEARKIIGELQQVAKSKYVSSYDVALIYVALGEKDQAFGWLEKAFAERSGSLIYLKVDPAMNSLRSDPRFTELMKRVGL